MAKELRTDSDTKQDSVPDTVHHCPLCGLAITATTADEHLQLHADIAEDLQRKKR